MPLAPDAPPATTGRRRLVFAAKLVVSVVLLAVLIGRSDAPRLWMYVRSASLAWLAAALGLYGLMVLASAWRWGLLLGAQGVAMSVGRLTESFLVATFFNNFLPSNIGGDVVRIADTAPVARSKTLAAAVVILDRAIGLLGLVLLAAMAASLAPGRAGATDPVPSGVLWAAFAGAMALALPAVVSPGPTMKLLSPLRVFHPEWVGPRLQRLTSMLARFREAPGALLGCFAGAVLVQALLVAFYAAVAHGVGVPVSTWHMAVIVPMSFLAQLVPISVNGFGVREAVFSYYFTQIGAPGEAGLIVSLLGAGLIILFSLTGAVAYVVRRG